MKSRAPLAFIEQLVMILVFALAAALCLRAFALAESRSSSSAERDRAVMEVTSAAEVLKSCRGDFEAAAKLCGGFSGEEWKIYFDENWEKTRGGGVYVLRARRLEAPELLGRADIEVLGPGGKSLASLSVSWQEVEGDE